MNFRIIAYIVGWVCNFQAMFSFIKNMNFSLF